MMVMKFVKGAIFTTAVLTILLCTPALAQKSPPASVSLPPSTSPAPAPAPHYVDLAALLGVAGPFHTFLNYLQKTDVLETFQSQANKTDEGITIFVPKDSAFSALKKSTFSNLTGDQLKTLLLYHAFPKYYPLATFRNLSVLNRGGASWRRNWATTPPSKVHFSYLLRILRSDPEKRSRLDSFPRPLFHQRRRKCYGKVDPPPYPKFSYYSQYIGRSERKLQLCHGRT